MTTMVGAADGVTAVARPRAVSPDRSGDGVPWGTVVPLALVLAVVDVFWLVVLRGTVGPVGASERPAVLWLRESLLSTPLFAGGVLAALTLARRWLGPVARGRRFWALAGLVVAGGTAAGSLLLLGQSFVDHRTQVEHVHVMALTHERCQAACVQLQLDRTDMLIQRALVVGVIGLVVVNLVAVLWTTALRGGRLDVVAGPGSVRTQVRWGRRHTVALALVGAALVHFAVVPQHLAEWPAAGAFFVVLGMGQVALGLVALRRWDATVRLAVIALTAGPLLMWVVSRTIGLPLGPEPGAAEAVGLADIACGLLELVALALLLVRSPARSRASGHGRALAAAVLVAVTAAGMAGSGISWLDVGAASHHVDGQ